MIAILSKKVEGTDEFIINSRSFEDFKNFSVEKELRNCKKKETIYSEGSYSKWVYYINKGKVKTYHSNDDGKEFITGLYKEGDFFGFLSQFEQDKYADSAMTFEDSELYLVPTEYFFSLIYKNAEMSRKYIKILTNNLQEKEQQLIKLAYNSVRKRVAESIITLYNRYKKEDGTAFSLSISREDLSNISGTATESAIRALAEFKEEGLIEINCGAISILNLEKLKNLRN